MAGFRGLGFRIQGSGFRVSGFGFRVSGSGFIGWDVLVFSAYVFVFKRILLECPLRSLEDDQPKVVTGSFDGDARIWSAVDGECLRILSSNLAAQWFRV